MVLTCSLEKSPRRIKKPKRASLPKGVQLESVTLDMAVGLLSLPRLLGTHPATGAPIKAGLGRFGPYIVHDQGKEGKDYRSLKAEDDVLTVSLDPGVRATGAAKAGARRQSWQHQEAAPRTRNPSRR